MARSIVAYVDETLDNARLGPVHKRVLAIIYRRIVLRRHRLHHLGLAGAGYAAHAFRHAGRDRHGRHRHLARAVYRRAGSGRVHRPLWPQGGFPVCRRLLQSRHDRRGAGAQLSAGSRLGALSPASPWVLRRRCAFPMPPNIRQSASVAASPLLCNSSAALAFGRSGTCWRSSLRDTVGWRGVWIIIGLGGLAVFAASFRLPESPRWLVTHGRGRRGPRSARRDGAGPPARRRNACSSMRSPTSAAIRWRSSSAAIAGASSPR